ncbi:hypothetical protein FRC17_006120 [Serendipita sp. 399]|nr:hypothetical protein FRC17_006120 [Serendipita sp. 399]
MVLKLYAHPLSSCGRRVGVVLHEKKVPYELISPDLHNGEIKSDAWKKNQPFGQMPYIDDDGFILFESRAIARYIATKYSSSGAPLLPSDMSDAQAVALVDQATSVENNNFNPGAEGLFVEKIAAKFHGREPNEEFIKSYEAKLTTKMDGFELLLSKQKYMAGDELTLPDLFFLPYGQTVTQLGYDFMTNETKWPNVARWWKDVSTREAWLAVKDGIPATGFTS